MRPRDRNLLPSVASMLIVVLVATVAPGRPEKPSPEDCIFTGEIKPLLYVGDVERSAGFYRDALGFEFDGFANRSDGIPYYAEMLAGRQKFGLHEPTVPGQEDRVGRARLYFRVKDLETHRRWMLARGAELGETIVTDWMDMAIVRDPDGNEIVFAMTDSSRHSIDPW